MPSKRTEKLLKARAAKRASKAAGMGNPGGRSRYAARMAARRNGAPMADRSREGQPWFEPLVRPGVVIRSPGFVDWLREHQRAVG